jgi:hypothetical protein
VKRTAGDETKKFPGPTKGRSHPNFVGLVKPGDTLEDKERTEFLIKKLKKGFNIEFPLDPDNSAKKIYIRESWIRSRCC